MINKLAQVIARTEIEDIKYHEERLTSCFDLASDIILKAKELDFDIAISESENMVNCWNCEADYTELCEICNPRIFFKKKDRIKKVTCEDINGAATTFCIDDFVCSVGSNTQPRYTGKIKSFCEAENGETMARVNVVTIDTDIMKEKEIGTLTFSVHDLIKISK